VKASSRWLAIVGLLSACACGDTLEYSVGELAEDSEPGSIDAEEAEAAEVVDDAPDARLGSNSQALCLAGSEGPCDDVHFNGVPPNDGREELGTFTSRGVCVSYTDRNFRGVSTSLWPGYTFTYVGSKMDNAISSFKLPRGCVVTAWSDRDQGGTELTFYSDTTFVGPILNDKISSFSCSCD
jgi:hypothetical protein